MAMWFTSDWHFGHANIIKYQPNRLQEFDLEGADDPIMKMNEMMVRQWNSQVAPDDHVWFLGDFGMGKIEHSLSYVSRLNGVIDVILGNHDRPHAIASRGEEKRAMWTERYLEAGFNSLQIDAAMEIDGIPVIMNHFPYSGDHSEEERYTNWRPKDDGKVLIHGHVHGLWQVNGRQVNVGMDAHGGRLLSYDEVAVFVKEAAGN